MSRPVTPVADRFWANVNKTETCWLWTGKTLKAGYGEMQIDFKAKKVHRVSYEMLVGPIPEGLFIDHICHTKSCVNPDHLRPVTHKQNHENRKGAMVDSQTGIRGVYWHKQVEKWVAQVCHNGRNMHLGTFRDINDAEAAVIAKRLELFTHNAVDRATLPKTA